MATVPLSTQDLLSGPKEIPVTDPTTGEHSTVSITPLGSGNEVGRSCVLVRHKGQCVMFDCGVHPAKSGIDSLPLFDGVRGSLASVDLALITHFHLDHCGALPYLCEQTAFDGRVFMTPPTRSFYRMVMNDFLRIGTSGQDIVTPEWLNHTIDRIETIDYHQEKRHKGIRFQALNAGHVLGAAMFLVDIAGVRVLYTGDYSCMDDRHLLGAELPPVPPDILIVESTYGILVQESRAERERLFTGWVHDIVTRGGRCLIPVFALGRAQELLLVLEEYWQQHKEVQHVPIHYASSLATKCMQLYKTSASAMNKRVRKQLDDNVNPFDFKYITSLKDLSTFEDNGPSVVLASPGMLQSGLSLELFERWCGDKRNGVIFAGYCVDGTLAKDVMAKPREVVRDDGKVLPLRCGIHTVSFSAHSDAKQTGGFIEQLKDTKHVVLVHGNAESMTKLAKRLTDDFAHRGLKVHPTRNTETIAIPFALRRTARLLGTAAARTAKAAELALGEGIEAFRSAEENGGGALVRAPGAGDEDDAAPLVAAVPATPTIEGVLLVSEDQQYTVVDPAQLGEFAQVHRAHIEQATVLPLPLLVPPGDVLRALETYFAESSMHAGLKPEAAKPEADDDDDGPTAVINVGAGVRAIVRQPPRATATTVVVQWRANRYADIVADVTSAAVLQLVDAAVHVDQRGSRTATTPEEAAHRATLWTRHPLAARDHAFRYQCLQRMLAHSYVAVRVNLATGVAVFRVPRAVPGFPHGPWLRVTQWLRIRALPAAPADDDPLEADDADDAATDAATEAVPADLRREVFRTLQRIYLGLNPVPPEVDADNATGAAHLMIDGGGWCGCGEAH